MQETAKTTFNGREIEVRELTVRQMREVFTRIDKEEPQFIDDLLNEPMPALIITECTGVTIEEMEKQKPSELIRLAREVKTINPTLAAMLARRIAAFEKMTSLLKNQSTETVAS